MRLISTDRQFYHYFLKQGLVLNSSGGVKRRDNKPPRIKCQCWKGAKHQLVQPPQYPERTGVVPWPLLLHPPLAMAVALLPRKQCEKTKGFGWGLWVAG